MYKDGCTHELKGTERTALMELKSRLEDIRDQDRRKLSSDFYLFQWLRGHGMNVSKAEVTIRNAFQWRKEIDLSDDFNDFPEEMATQFPIYDDSFTKTGMPVYSVFVEEWDVKKAIDAGDEERLRRYVYFRTLRGENEWLAYNERALQKHGVKVMYHPETVHFLVNAENVLLEKLAVPRVVESVIGSVKRLGGNFPGNAIEIIFLNISMVYYLAFSVFRPFLNFAAKVEVYNCNVAKWKKALSEFIEPDQLFRQFGGNKI